MELNQANIQAAVKDINTILTPTPKLKFIGPKEVLRAQIVDCLAAQVNYDGSWKDDRCATLAASTIEVYNALVAEMTAPAGGATATEPPGEECFGKGFSAEVPECGACGDSAACAEAMKAAPKVGAKKTKEEKAAEKAAAKEATKVGKEAEKARKKEERAAAKAAGKPAVERGPGVISSIFALLQTGPHTKEELLAKLKAQFPDRNPDSMKATISVQLPSRMAKEKNVSITKNEAGKYTIG